MVATLYLEKERKREIFKIGVIFVVVVILSLNINLTCRVLKVRSQKRCSSSLTSLNGR